MPPIDVKRVTADLMVTLAKDYGPPGAFLKREATIRAKTIFDDAVIGMKKDFEEHKVTLEIDGGIASDNISDTLGGGASPENLFAFIGFKEGDTPTAPIRKALDPSDPSGPRLSVATKVAGNVPRYSFEVTGPKINRIYDQTSLPWGPKMSWAEKIETHIPGFAKFLARYTKSEASRSGGGTQVKADLHADTFTPPEGGYLTGIFNNFANSIRNFKKQRFR